MKRALLIAMLLLVAVAASAETSNRLLTADGALYSVSAVPALDMPDVVTESSTLLLLNTRRNGEISSEVIPASLTHGWHYSPSLAYDAGSGTLFLFWIRNNSLMFNELLVAARMPDGTWSEATKFGSPWDFRENLRIAVTRRVADSVNGTTVPGISVHLTWWEFDTTTGTESARYAMVVIENGAILSIDELELKSLLPGEPVAETPTADTPVVAADRLLLKQPILYQSRDHVTVTFGSFETGHMHRATIRPSLPLTPNGRLRVPVGRSDGDLGAPTLTVSANATVDGIADDDGLALYTREGNTMRYVLFRDGLWSAPHEITLGDELESAAAVDALRRLVREH